MDDELFSRTREGRVVDQVVELDTVLMILRPVGREDGKKKLRKVERLILPKFSSQEYFRERIGDVPVKISDPAVASKLRATISWARDVRWVR